MKTTLDIPNPLLRQVKAYAALKGQPMKRFFIDAVKERLHAEVARNAGKHEPAWVRLFGAGKEHRAAIREVQSLLDKEFSRINPEDWK